jgi:hypothetical protein
LGGWEGSGRWKFIQQKNIKGWKFFVHDLKIKNIKHLI